jgi:hypothetical protein
LHYCKFLFSSVCLPEKWGNIHCSYILCRCRCRYIHQEPTYTEWIAPSIYTKRGELPCVATFHLKISVQSKKLRRTLVNVFLVTLECKWCGSFYRKIISPKFFDRTPFHRKAIWPNTVWPKGHLTETPFDRAPFDQKVHFSEKSHLAEIFFYRKVDWKWSFDQKFILKK